MIIHLDSTYRCITTYPYPSDFEIDFNGQSLSNRDARDVRGENVTMDYAQYSFQWIGDMTSPLFYRPRDSILVRAIPINAYTCVLVDTNEHFRLNDYFVGLLLYIPLTHTSATIIQYRESLGFLITVDQPLFEGPYTPMSTMEYLQSDPETVRFLEVMIINPSFSLGNNLVILGSTKLLPTTSREFALAKGLNTNLFVQNVTKGWTSKIKSIVGSFRTVILSESLLPYDSNDIFIVWQKKIEYIRTTGFFVQGIWQYTIVESIDGLSVHEELVGENEVRFKIDRIDHHGRALGLCLVHPGEYFRNNEIVELRRPRQMDHVVRIRVLQTGNGIVFDGCVAMHENEKDFPGFLIGVLDPTNIQMLYYSVISYYNRIVFVNITPDEALRLNDLYAINKNVPFWIFLIPFFTLYPTITAPIVPYQNAVCYEVSIVSISLPNLPVCGFNILLADIPYVLVTLVNVNTPNNDTYGTMISNNPNSFSANFVCPIANIRNPDIIKFVVVSSNQKTVFKFTPRNSIRFRVTLPNGELLKYSNQTYPYSYSCQENTLTSGCQSINLPLNINTLDNNAVRVFPLMTSNLISATFFFRRL